jgi:hypothetical protein
LTNRAERKRCSHGLRKPARALAFQKRCQRGALFLHSCARTSRVCPKMAVPLRRKLLNPNNRAQDGLAFGPLAAAGAHRNTAFLMLAEFVLKLSLEPLLPETKCRTIKALLDTFPTDTATEAQLPEARVSAEKLIVRSASDESERCRRERQFPACSDIHGRGPRRNHCPSCTICLPHR